MIFSSKKIIIKGLSPKATRLEVANAKKAFDEVCKRNADNDIKLRKIGEILKELKPDDRSIDYQSIGQEVYGLPAYDLMYGENYIDIIETHAFDYALNWINEILSHTYIHSENKKVRLPEKGTLDGKSFYNAGNGHEIINRFTPKSALDFLFHFFEQSERRMKQVLESYYSKKV